MNFLNPLISIGLPTYNGGKSISKVLDSICNQTYHNFELIISDNCSSDNTTEICLEYAKKDERINFFRQKENVGLADNYKFVYNSSNGKYFMWWADDDIRENNFLFECFHILESNEKCVAATTLDRWEHLELIRTFELTGNIYRRFINYLINSWDSGGIFYSLIRKEIIKDFDFTNFRFLGGDWMFMVFLLSKGEIKRSPLSVTIFGNNGISYSEKAYSNYRFSFIHWFLPFYGFSRYLIFLSKDLKLHQKLHIIELLIKLNIKTAFNQIIFELKLFKRKLNNSN